MKEVKTIILSRTDSIGDVVLTLPVVHTLKHKFPGSRIIFLGKSYTKPVLECCSGIDEIVCWDEIVKLDEGRQLEFFKTLHADCIIHVFPNKQVAALAKKAGIPLRIGTSHRLFHWFTCNKLPNFTRKNSPLHEAQLNFKLLEPLGISADVSLNDIRDHLDFRKVKPLSPALLSLIDTDRQTIILHPKSKGSALEWGISNFSALVKLLPKDRFKVFVTGTEQEKDFIRPILAENPEVVDMTGKLSLSELISFINHSTALVAASTGPLHLAAVLGKHAVGIYPAKRPIHPGRWAPVGKQVTVLVSKKTCAKCNAGKDCDCLSSVSPQEVAEALTGKLK